MQTVDTVINARWVIPVRPDNTILENHSVVIHDGAIVAILPSLAAAQQYDATTLHSLTEHALIPGLINTHTHASMNLLKGFADDLPLMDWLQNHIWPAEAANVSPEFVYDGTQLAVAESFRAGVTCLNEMYFFPYQAAQAASDAGMRMCVGLILIDFPTAWAAGPDDYLAKGVNVHDAFRHNPLITTALAPHAPYTVSDAPLRRALTLAEQLDIPIHMHIHETAFEVAEAEQKTGKRPLARLKELGLLGPRLMAVHMTQLTDQEITDLANYGVHVIHNPQSNMKLASGICPTVKLLEAGVNVALGTDGCASNNDLDMLNEMQSAALIAKVASGNAAALPAHTALRMATLNGAKALGLEAVTGSLEVGKAADITAIDLSALETQPVYNPISQIVYAAGRHQVSDVWVDGRQVLKQHQLTTLNEEQLRRKAQRWAQKIQQSRKASS
ncbi:MAG: TRZ/ATZ family hydrolase [Gammaproteobacteria bacterium]|nr:TRZ/ATZ family hydrolase [Gammaproteobacteria bacterium]